MLKKKLKNIICVCMALLLCLAPFAVPAASAVNYPEGVTAEDCAAVLPKLETLVGMLMEQGDTDLSASLYKTVLSDDTLNMLFAGVYNAMAENAGSLSVVGVELTPATLSAALKGFGNVSAKISGCADLAAVVKASENFVWEVDTKERFGEAVSAMFSPFNKLLNMLLCSGTAAIAPLVFIKGDDGYTNAIVPILETLGCPEIMSSESFAAAAKNDMSSMMKNVVKMLFSSIDKLLEKPVDGICTVLPCAAWFINEGKLTECINKLVEPLSLHLGLISIPGVSSLLSGVANLENTEDVAQLLKNVDLSALTGGTNISLPEIDLDEMASCGSAENGKFTPDKSAALVTVLRWALDLVKMNSANLTSVFGNAASAVNSLLKKADDDLIKLLVDLLTSQNTLPANNYEWKYPEITPAQITYTPTLNRDDYNKVVNEMDAFLDEVAAEKDPEATIYDTIAPMLFSDSTASLITVSLYTALASEETAPLFTLLGADVSPAGVAAAIASSYPAAARTLSSYSSWSGMNASSLHFGFTDGDKDGFGNALCAALSPFLPLLSFVLSEKSITLFDMITLPGGDGYNTAVIPLLEALGCAPESIKSYDAYKATAATAGLSDILSPVLSLLDELCHTPVLTACRIIPNIVYFINSDGLKACMDNLLYPVTQFLSEVGLSDLLPKELTEMKLDINFNDLTGKLLSSSELSLKLPEPDLRKLAYIGTPTTLTSKRTVNGAPTQYTAVVSDSPAVLLTALRYLVKTLSMEENAEVLSGFMSGIMSSSDSEKTDEASPDMMGMYVGSVTEKFKGMTDDEIIEWLYNLLFRETPPVEETPEEVYVPADLTEVKDPVDTVKIVVVIVVIVILAALVLWFLNSKGYFEDFAERREEKKRLKAEKNRKAGAEKKTAKKQKAQKPAKAKKKNTPADEAPAVPDIPAELRVSEDGKPVTFTSRAHTDASAAILAAAAAEQKAAAPKKAPAPAPQPVRENIFLDPLSDIKAKYVPQPRQIPAAAEIRLAEAELKAKEAEEEKKKSPPLNRKELLMPLSYDKAGKKMEEKKKSEPKKEPKKKPAEPKKPENGAPAKKPVPPVKGIPTKRAKPQRAPGAARTVNPDFLDDLMEFNEKKKKNR